MLFAAFFSSGELAGGLARIQMCWPAAQKVTSKMHTHAGAAETCSKTGTPGRARAFLSILSYFLRKVVFSPARLLRVLTRMASNLSMQFRVFQLLRSGVYARFVCANPAFLFKYLSPKYLIRDLPVNTRTTCFLRHYLWLHSAMPHTLLRRILVDDVNLIELHQDEHLFAVALGRSREVADTRHIDHEGEMSIHLLVDKVHAYVLSFTIVPGWVARSNAANVLMITRVQGSLGVFPKIAMAARAMHGIPPEMLLITALQGVGQALGVSTMAGVSAARHLCYDQHDDAIFRKCYDDFFARIGAVRNAADFYLAPFPLPEKPLSEVKRGQKTRSRARRAFKLQVAAAAFQALRIPATE